MSPLLYRVFLRALTVFFILSAAFGAAPVSAAPAADAYTVKGVMVDETGTSALDARSKAFAQARRKAYEAVADKMLSAKARPGLVVPDDKVIASLVRDFEIVNEKMTSRRYAGTIDVRFTPAAVKRTMQVSSVRADNADAPAADVEEKTVTTTVTDDAGVVTTTIMPASARNAPADDGYVYSPPRRAAARTEGTKPASKVVTHSVLVLPWYGMTGRQTLWGQGNPWRAAWEEKDALAKDKVMPIVLPVGDAADVGDYSPPQPLSRRGDIAGLMRRYQAESAVLALAEPDSNGSVVVSLYRYESGSPVPVGRFAVDGNIQDPLGEAVSRAAVTLRALPVPAAQPMPVSMQSPVPSQISMPPVNVGVSGGSFHTLARFSGLQEWVAMRQALSRVPGVGGIAVRSISPSQANVEFSYEGDTGALASALGASGLQLSMLPPGAFVASGPGDSTPQYLLSMGRVY